MIVESIITITGNVVHGKGLGHTVGMPTANIDITNNAWAKSITPGVYASLVKVNETVRLAVTNIGTKPTVDDSGRTNLEAHILDFDEDIYGQTIEVTLTHYLRGISKFDSLSAVQQQVSKDIVRTRSLLSDYL